MAGKLDIDGAFAGDTDAEPLFSDEETDAVSTGAVRESKATDIFGDAGDAKPDAKGKQKQRQPIAGSEDEVPGEAEADADSVNAGTQRRAVVVGLLAGAAADELDDSDELEGVGDLERNGRVVVHKAKQVAARRKQAKESKAAVAGEEADGAKSAMQSRRTWVAARESQAATQATAAQAAKVGGSKGIAAAASSAAAPALGILAGVVCFVLAALVVSQAVSSLFAFWENESQKSSVEGLPPYITYEMVEAALECQEKYGHPAGCTIAQIICESGVGDHLSGLATQDNNLFGIKWAPSFASAPEVTGKSSWSTGEEYGGEHVTIMADFTSFKSFKDCIVFRSRVLLQNSRYAGNSLIKEAIAEHDSDKMAEGLKAAGYATDSSYVESLKSAMKTYNLYRFDGLSVDDWKGGGADGNAIVEAAYSQLGVPYVWGGSTPNVALDCSGLTQYCYRQAGISIPHYSEDQAKGGTKVPLAQAKPGDILWRPGHVAIYVGGDQYIHEPHSGAVCTLASGISYFTCAIRY